ncbi:MAG TPA: hypothetical protein VHX18_03840 [Rhizomicrobium sp.]|nr:hypothetical protein [Rhizomicrobium sp.]
MFRRRQLARPGAGGGIDREEDQQGGLDHVRDCVDIMLWLLDNPSISGLFNLGTGQARSWWDLAEAMFAAVNRACAIEFMDMPVAISVSYQNYTQADIGKLRNAGYDRPFTSLEDGVRDYISGYLARDDIYL